MNDGATNKLSRLAVLAALALLSGVAWSQQHYKVDPASSEVHFTLGASDGPVNGTFRVTSGEFTLESGDRRHDRYSYRGRGQR